MSNGNYNYSSNNNNHTNSLIDSKVLHLILLLKQKNELVKEYDNKISIMNNQHADNLKNIYMDYLKSNISLNTFYQELLVTYTSSIGINNDYENYNNECSDCSYNHKITSNNNLDIESMIRELNLTNNTSINNIKNQNTNDLSIANIDNYNDKDKTTNIINVIINKHNNNHHLFKTNTYTKEKEQYNRSPELKSLKTDINSYIEQETKLIEQKRENTKNINISKNIKTKKANNKTKHTRVNNNNRFNPFNKSYTFSNIINLHLDCICYKKSISNKSNNNNQDNKCLICQDTYIISKENIEKIFPKYLKQQKIDYNEDYLRTYNVKFNYNISIWKSYIIYRQVISDESKSNNANAFSDISYKLNHITGLAQKYFNSSNALRQMSFKYDYIYNKGNSNYIRQVLNKDLKLNSNMVLLVYKITDLGDRKNISSNNSSNSLNNQESYELELSDGYDIIYTQISKNNLIAKLLINKDILIEGIKLSIGYCKPTKSLLDKNIDKKTISNNINGVVNKQYISFDLNSISITGFTERLGKKYKTPLLIKSMRNINKYGGDISALDVIIVKYLGGYKIDKSNNMNRISLFDFTDLKSVAEDEFIDDEEGCDDRIESNSESTDEEIEEDECWNDKDDSIENIIAIQDSNYEQTNKYSQNNNNTSKSKGNKLLNKAINQDNIFQNKNISNKYGNPEFLKSHLHHKKPKIKKSTKPNKSVFKLNIINKQRQIKYDKLKDNIITNKNTDYIEYWSQAQTTIKMKFLIIDTLEYYYYYYTSLLISLIKKTTKTKIEIISLSVEMLKKLNLVEFLYKIFPFKTEFEKEAFLECIIKDLKNKFNLFDDVRKLDISFPQTYEFIINGYNIELSENTRIRVGPLRIENSGSTSLIYNSFMGKCVQVEESFFSKMSKRCYSYIEECIRLKDQRDSQKRKQAVDKDNDKIVDININTENDNLNNKKKESIRETDSGNINKANKLLSSNPFLTPITTYNNDFMNKSLSDEINKINIFKEALNYNDILISNYKESIYCQDICKCISSTQENKNKNLSFIYDTSKLRLFYSIPFSLKCLVVSIHNKLIIAKISNQGIPIYVILEIHDVNYFKSLKKYNNEVISSMNKVKPKHISNSIIGKEVLIKNIKLSLINYITSKEINDSICEKISNIHAGSLNRNTNKNIFAHLLNNSNDISKSNLDNKHLIFKFKTDDYTEMTIKNVNNYSKIKDEEASNIEKLILTKILYK